MGKQINDVGNWLTGGGGPDTPSLQDAAGKTADSANAQVDKQTTANRPNQDTPWANSQWAMGPNGEMQQTTGFNGPMAGASNALQGQFGANMGQPMDWSQFGPLDNGSAARDQAITASYGQSAKRLNPQWDQRGQQMSSSLANQGLDPNSQAARNAQHQFGQQRNDAYDSAMNSAIHDGTAAQTATFNQNLMARQQSIAEALKARGQPMSELQQMQGFLQMPGFQGAGAGQGTNYLGAQEGDNNSELEKWKAQMGLRGDIVGGGMNALTGAIGLGMKAG